MLCRLKMSAKYHLLCNIICLFLFTKKYMWSKNLVKKERLADPLHNKGRMSKIPHSQQSDIQEFQLPQCFIGVNEKFIVQ